MKLVASIDWASPSQQEDQEGKGQGGQQGQPDGLEGKPEAVGADTPQGLGGGAQGAAER